MPRIAICKVDDLRSKSTAILLQTAGCSMLASMVMCLLRWLDSNPEAQPYSNSMCHWGRRMLMQSWPKTLAETFVNFFPKGYRALTTLQVQSVTLRETNTWPACRLVKFVWGQKQVEGGHASSSQSCRGVAQDLWADPVLLYQAGRFWHVQVKSN